jgi:hypothetical protein
MENEKLKMKIGEHELEVEAAHEVVERRVADFKELIALLAKESANNVNVQNLKPELPASKPLPILERILKNDGRIVSLTAPPDAVDDAALLILLGQRILRNNDSVTGNEIMSGLSVSGYALDRVDRLMEKFVEEGWILSMGRHRAKRYRLTNPGYSKAAAIAESLASTLP